MAQTTIKTTKKITRKLSTAVGLLSFFAFIIQGLGATFGFQGVANQIVQACLIVSGAVNIYFLGNTSQKNIQEAEQNEKDK